MSGGLIEKLRTCPKCGVVNAGIDPDFLNDDWFEQHRPKDEAETWITCGHCPACGHLWRLALYEGDLARNISTLPNQECEEEWTSGK